MTYTTKKKYRKLLGTNIFSGEGNIRTGSAVLVRKKDGTKEQARPIGYRGLLWTVKCSLLVLFGYADIVVWSDENENL